MLGLIENMSTYICPNCGHEAHIFGHGGARAEAERLDMPFLGEIPLDLAIRVAGDERHARSSPPRRTVREAQAFRRIARRLVAGGHCLRPSHARITLR